MQVACVAHDFSWVDDFLEACRFEGEPSYERDAGFILSDLRKTSGKHVTAFLRCVSLQNMKHQTAGDKQYDVQRLKDCLKSGISELNDEQKK